MGGISTERVILLKSKTAVGSATLIGPSLVLTAAHVVGNEPVGAGVWIRRGESWMSAQVVWRGDNPEARPQPIDAVLVGITDQRWIAPALPPLRWGRLVGRRPDVASEATGFPRALRSPDFISDTDHLTALINPGSRRVSGLYDLTVVSAAPESLKGETSPWAGMSGAGVFANDTFVAVILADVKRYRGQRLSSLPAYRIAAAPGFAEAIEHFGVSWPGSDDFEAVELDGLLAPSNPTPHRRADDKVFSPATLLRPEAEVVRFRGREELSRSLLEWCLDDAPNVGVRLISGPGGQGKTRLGRFVADQVPARAKVKTGDAQWIRGFLAALQEGADVTPLADLDAPLLLIIDYAETRTTELRSLLPALWSTDSSHAVRVILLARGAGEWWDQLCLDLGGHVGAVIELGQLDEATDRPNHYADAVAAFGERLRDITGDAAFEHGVALQIPADLHHPRFGSPLTLQLSALTALLERRDPLAVPGGEEPAERTLLRHEERYWTRTAERFGLALSGTVLRRAVAAATLCGAESFEDAVALTRVVPGIRDLDEDRVSRLDQLLGGLYPSDSQQRWGTLQPDRIGEFLVGEALTAESGVIAGLLRSTNSTRSHRALTVLARAMANPALGSAQVDALRQETCFALTSHLESLGPIAVQVVSESANPKDMAGVVMQAARDADLEALRVVVHAMPLFSQSLSGASAEWTARLVDETRAMSNTEPESFDLQYKLAIALNSHFGSLRTHNRDREAVDAIAETVDIFRRLAPAIQQLLSQGFVSTGQGEVLWLAGSTQERLLIRNLAMGLNNYASVLKTVGREVDARSAAIEAVETIRVLASKSDPASRADLAHCLTTRSAFVINPEDSAQAVAAATEAVQIYEDLSNSDPDAYKHFVAMAQINLSATEVRSGGIGEALEPLEAAVATFRQCAAERPDTFLRDLATALGNRASILGGLGRHDVAMASAQEAVDLFRRLYADTPSIHGPKLVSALSTLSQQFYAVGRRDDGAHAATEAVRIGRQLIENGPRGSQRPEVASAFVTLAETLNTSGKHTEAVVIAREAVIIEREAGKDRPAEHEGGLAAALVSLSNALSDNGQITESLEAATEAAAIHRQMAVSTPSARAKYAESSFNTANRLLAVGRKKDALAAATESVNVFAQLASEHPRKHIRNHAAALDTLASALMAMGTTGEALGRGVESVELRRRVATEQPSELLALARGLRSAADRLIAVGMHQDAMPVLRESVQHYRYVVSKNDGAHLGDLAQTLMLEARAYAELGQREEALRSGAESLAIQRERAANDIEVYGRDLADALSAQSSWLGAIGLKEHAVSSAQEAVTLLQQLGVTNDLESHRGLATALRTLSIAHEAAWHPKEAAESALAAVRVLRNLTASLPDHRTDLARALQSYSIALTSVGDPEGSLAAISETVAILREVAAEQPRRDLTDLALALTNQSDSFITLNRVGEVTKAARESVEMHRQIGSHEPGSPQADKYGLALNNLFFGLHHQGAADDALRVISAAVEVYRGLPSGASAQHAGDLARALSNQSGALAVCGFSDHALGAVSEAVEIYRDIASGRPTIGSHKDLAFALINKSNRLNDLNHGAAAFTAAKEAVALYRPAFEQAPRTTITTFAGMLQGLFDQAHPLGHDEDAEAAISEAVTVYRQLAATSPEYKSLLATGLLNSAIMRAKLGRTGAAVAPAKESATVYATLAQHDHRYRDGFGRAASTFEGLMKVTGYDKNQIAQELRQLPRLP